MFLTLEFVLIACWNVSAKMDLQAKIDSFDDSVSLMKWAEDHGLSNDERVSMRSICLLCRQMEHQSVAATTTTKDQLEKMTSLDGPSSEDSTSLESIKINDQRQKG
ncbi:uncharacterized protein LOC124288836 [Haliotis rubra]|uniref:uncharacterized protein LOC124288836 n=1 Tax=Haliotis rubra TaxID=36100 RepID=UPI001EE59551|nr:uncharacterized protein LOC124288836 [Haliotis rubra]